jgi:hypothetical protein
MAAPHETVLLIAVSPLQPALLRHRRTTPFNCLPQDARGQMPPSSISDQSY